jgi:hypothetical protein
MELALPQADLPARCDVASRPPLSWSTRWHHTLMNHLAAKLRAREHLSFFFKKITTHAISIAIILNDLSIFIKSYKKRYNFFFLGIS